MISRCGPTLFCAFAVLFCDFVPIRADELTLPAGTDSFMTDPSRTFVNSYDLPTGFFGEVGGVASDAITTPTMNFGGVGGTCSMPVDIRPPGVIELPDNGPGEAGASAVHSPLTVFTSSFCDTQVQRQSDAVFANVGDSATIPIEIVSLSLKSVSPLAVTYGGGSTNFFDVFVNLAPGPEPIGSMTLTRTGDFSGTFVSTLPVLSRLTFSNEDPSGPAAVAQPERLDVLSSSRGTFFVTPEPSSLLLQAAVLGLMALALRLKKRRNSTHVRGRTALQ